METPGESHFARHGVRLESRNADLEAILECIPASFGWSGPPHSTGSRPARRVKFSSRDEGPRQSRGGYGAQGCGRAGGKAVWKRHAIKGDQQRNVWIRVFGNSDAGSPLWLAHAAQ